MSNILVTALLSALFTVIYIGFMALGAYLHHQAIKRVVDDCLKDQTHG